MYKIKPILAFFFIICVGIGINAGKAWAWDVPTFPNQSEFEAANGCSGLTKPDTCVNPIRISNGNRIICNLTNLFAVTAKRYDPSQEGNDYPTDSLLYNSIPYKYLYITRDYYTFTDAGVFDGCYHFSPYLSQSEQISAIQSDPGNLFTDQRSSFPGYNYDLIGSTLASAAAADGWVNDTIIYNTADEDITNEWANDNVPYWNSPIDYLGDPGESGGNESTTTDISRLPSPLIALGQYIATSTVGFAILYINDFWIWIVSFIAIAAFATFIYLGIKKLLSGYGGK